MLTLLEIRRAEFNKNLENPLYDGISRLGGGGSAHSKHFSHPLSLAVEEFRSLEGFTCWFGKAVQLLLLWGGRSCVSIANYRFGEGVHPVRVNTCHCEGGKCNGLVATPTSMEGRCKTC